MRIRLHVEDFEIEIGNADRHHPIAQVVGAALAPAVTSWLERNLSRFWPPNPAPATPPDPSDAGDESRHVVEGAAAPGNGAAAAEV